MKTCSVSSAIVVLADLLRKVIPFNTRSDTGGKYEDPTNICLGFASLVYCLYAFLSSQGLVHSLGRGLLDILAGRWQDRQIALSHLTMMMSLRLT